MFKEIAIFIKDDMSKGKDNDALNSMINSLSNLDINLYIDKASKIKNDRLIELDHDHFVKKVECCVQYER